MKTVIIVPFAAMRRAWDAPGGSIYEQNQNRKNRHHPVGG